MNDLTIIVDFPSSKLVYSGNKLNILNNPLHIACMIQGKYQITDP